MLDCLLISKVLVKSKKKDDMLEIVDKIEMPDLKIIDQNSLDSK